jgi:hypothetical protein
MNIAERYLDYYGSENFEQEYAYFLSDEAAYGVESLQSACNQSNNPKKASEKTFFI